MRTVDTLPGESNAQIISSIINLVCPQCGGRMSEFQCDGRCSRNWLAEWEWANQSTRSPKSQRGQAVSGRDGLRSQPVRSARERKPARHISVVCGPCLPLAHSSDF